MRKFRILARNLYGKISKKSGTIHRLLWVLLVANIIAIGLVIKNRNENLTLSAPISYQQLYSSAPKISAMLRKGASIVVVAEKSAEKNKETEKSGVSWNTNVIKINSQTNPIEVQEGCLNIEGQAFKVRFSMQDLEGGLVSPDAGWVYLVGSDIDIDLYSRGNIGWFKSSLSVSRNVQSSQINHLILNAIKATCGQRGKPSKTTERSTLDQLEKEIEINKSQVWCEQIAKYCQHKICKHAKTRIVTIGDTREISSGIRNSGHTILEIYSYERGCWYAVDPTLGIISFRSASNEFLNAIEILMLNRRDQNHLLSNLICECVDLKTGQIHQRRYDDLDNNLKGEIRSRYKFNDLVVFHTWKSLIYDRGLLNKIKAVFSTERQFHFAWNPSYWSMCEVRVVLLKLIAVIASLIVAFKAFFAYSRSIAESGATLHRQDDAI